MDINTVKNSLTQTFGRTGLKLQKHSPEILLGAGLVGGVVAAVMAARATLRVKAISNGYLFDLHEVEKAEIKGITESGEAYSLEDAAKDKVILRVQTALKFAQLYGPAVGVGILSITAILASHGIMHNRQVALVAAYNLLQEGFKNYRDRVAEELGADREEQFYLGVRGEEYSETEVDEDGKKKKVKKTKYLVDPSGRVPSVYSRFFDNSNPNFRSDRMLNKAFLIAQQNYINDVLIIRGHVFLNEVYERLGFDHTKEGAIVGWVLKDPETMRAEKRDGYITFGLEEADRQATREFVNLTNDAILLDFNVDGLMFDQI